MNNSYLYSAKLLHKWLLVVVCVNVCVIHIIAQSTVLFNNGAQFYTAPAAILHLNGSFQNDNTAGTSNVFENNGTMTIANSNTPGSVLLTANSTLLGNGTYLVEQDWINDATFNANSSTVNFNGNSQQYITSSNGTSTTFNNVILSGTGIANNRKKTLQLVNAQIGTNGTLTLNDREFETGINTLYILNPSPACITNNTTPGNEGFVSSDFSSGNSGYLSRITNSSSAYLYPTGSSTGTGRYRPVIIAPISSGNNTYTARLGNNNATVDGFNTTLVDSGICAVNALFYHEITRANGTDDATIEIFYDSSTDGGWDGMAKWNSPSNTLWNSMGIVTASTNVPYNSIQKLNWSDFSNSPYILSKQKPLPPVLSCPEICSNSQGNVFSATGTGTIYNWIAPSGATITSGQTTNAVTIDWDTTTSAPVSVSTFSALGCESNIVSCFVTVPSLLAQFTSQAVENHYFNFTDLSSGDISSWQWDFNNGVPTTQQSPENVYLNCGSQQVCLTIYKNSCSDSSCINIEVNEVAIIPNIFSPDGDGINDVFYINNLCLDNFELEIYNRWGQKIYATTTGAGWDGYSSAGTKASEGTYFFIFKGMSAVSGKDYSIQGSLTLVRNK